MNFTSNAPMMMKYGATHAKRMTSSRTLGFRAGRVAIRARDAIPTAAMTASAEVETTITAAGSATPVAAYAAAARHPIPRTAAYASVAHASAPSGSPKPHAASCLM